MESKEDEKGQWHPVIYFGKTNLNGRVYEKESLSEEAVEKMRDAMDNKQFLGELGHPQGLSEQFNPSFPIVSLGNVSHVVEEVEVHSDIMFAKVRTLDTPSGKMVKALQQAMGDQSVVFRPRAIGEVIDGIVNIHQIISFDAVAVQDDSFKELQERYDEMIKTDLGRMPELPDLPEVNASFHRKNDENSTEQ